jgi:hypothetical protein
MIILDDPKSLAPSRAWAPKGLGLGRAQSTKPGITVALRPTEDHEWLSVVRAWGMDCLSTRDLITVLLYNTRGYKDLGL